MPDAPDSLAISEFKATCLKVLDQVRKTGKPVLVTKRGEPLALVVPPLVAMCNPGRPMVLLVKPQFEAGRAEVSRGKGVVTDPAVHERVRAEVGDALASVGCSVHGWTTSPITGADGNTEFLVHAETPS